MTSVQDLAQNMDWQGLLGLLLSVAVSLFCITFHELSHGYAAFRLGDPTAKNAGRLTWNPVRHIDPFGLVMMATVHVGWAKPVPVDMRYFKDPKKGMALTALAGPLSNLFLSLVAVALSSLIYHVPLRALEASGSESGQVFWLALLCVLSNLAILSTGLGVFNLIPLPPLDGSKILFAVFPNRVYHTILRYERYVMILVIVLTMAGALAGPLSYLIFGALRALCAVTRYPLGVLLFVQDISFLF